MKPHVFSFASTGDAFLLDGEPLQIRSGELHPARIPREYWRHRIQMTKAMGMNTVALYVMWNYHEANEGEFDFHSGNRDIEAFIRLCQAEDMWVLLRPGPYVCAEWDLGGIPWWLLRHLDIRLRTNFAGDPHYMPAVARYIGELAPRMLPLMIENGGPILMIQVENEFGSYASDAAYLEEIRQLWIRSGVRGPFFTEDGLVQLQQNRSNVKDGAIALSNGNAAQIASVRQAFPSVPAMAGEVYPGWLTHWGDAAMQGTGVDLSATIDEFMRKSLSFNLYVIHGGTSFGFHAGANIEAGEYQPDITSYDYSAPISEQGAASAKYMRYREIIARYLTEPLPEVPAPVATLPAHLPPLMPQRYASVWDNLPPSVLAEIPQPFEMLGQESGFVLYRKRLMPHQSGLLDVGYVHDYATVFIDGRYVCGLSRVKLPQPVSQPLNVLHRERLAVPAASSVLDIFVEGMGRVNYGPDMVDRKGIVDAPTLAGAPLKEWEIFLLPMTASYIESLQPICVNSDRAGQFFRAVLSLDNTGDVYFDMSQWTKGVVWVNGHNLGRYWNLGPQTRLYCPAPWLNAGDNIITIFDLHQTKEQPVPLAATLTL